MNLAGPFIRRPIMTTLTMFSVLLFGVLAYRALPVSDLPNVDYPQITVSAGLPGASPDTMASSVATPLEKEFTTIAGVDSMTSSSTQGSTTIALQFALNRDIDAAAQDVQAAIARAVRKLPANMPAPPSYRKVNSGDAPILWLTLTSPLVPMSQLDEFGQTLIGQRISMVDGVAQVQVYGSQKYAVRLQLDPRELFSRGVGINEVAAAVASQNVSGALGNLSGPYQAATLLDNGQLLDARSYEPLIVSKRNGNPVRLRDLGVALDSVENAKAAAWYTVNGVRQRAIVLAILRQPGTNTVQVADSVKALLPYFRSQLPASVSLDVLRDGSKTIRESASDVQYTLLLTLALVVLVIFLFLRNVSATLIPSLTLPFSLIGTFAVMYMLDYSMDNLSLMALTLSVGFVVDDAIVVLENIVRHMEMGKSRLQAAFDGSKEIGFTVVSMTLSLAAVFIPVLFMSGIVGRLFREFSVTIGAAVLVSGIVALTLTPMMSSRFLRDPHKIRHGHAYKVSEAIFQGMVNAYSWMLRGVLRHKLATMLLSMTVLGGMYWLFTNVSKDFIPLEDRDQISVNTEVAQDVSFDSTVEHQLALADIVQQNPNVEKFMCRAGANSGGMFLVLKPRKERKLSAAEVINELRPKLNAVPGVKVTMSIPAQINTGSRQSRSPYQLTLQGGDLAELYRYSTDLEQKMNGLKAITDISSDLQQKNPQINVTYDRDECVNRGLTPAQVQEALQSAFATRQVTTIMAPNNSYAVIMELLPQYQASPASLELLYIRSNEGDLVPLKSVARLSQDVGPLSVNHTGQLPSVTLSFNLAAGVSLGEAMDKVKALADEERPNGVTATFQGTAQAFQTSMDSMKMLLVLAIVVIYVVLGILYESFYHPITILSALPFAGFGALLTLYVFHLPLSVYAFVGIIMLIGLVKKNGIMMVDFALEVQRSEGKSAAEAIHEACIIRFRPIMMTTLAALMGGLPIAMGYGAGAESRQPLGLAVVGGLLFSQTLTLFVTPVFFVYMEKLRMWLHPAARHTPAATAAPARAQA